MLRVHLNDIKMISGPYERHEGAWRKDPTKTGPNRLSFNEKSPRERKSV